MFTARSKSTGISGVVSAERSDRESSELMTEVDACMEMLEVSECLTIDGVDGAESGMTDMTDKERNESRRVQ